MTSSPLKKLSEAEYLSSEPSSSHRREYVDGFVYTLPADAPTAQAGATSRHGTVATNLVAALHAPARRSGCRVYASDMRVRIPTHGTRYYYPDLLITCEDMPDDARYTNAPCLIVEILSDSTQDTDRREKLWAYQQLPSLQGYLLVDTGTRAARLYTRTGNSWSEDYVEGAGALTLPCVNISVSLDEMYDGTAL